MRAWLYITISLWSAKDPPTPEEVRERNIRLQAQELYFADKHEYCHDYDFHLVADVPSGWPDLVQDFRCLDLLPKCDRLAFFYMFYMGVQVRDDTTRQARGNDNLNATIPI